MLLDYSEAVETRHALHGVRWPTSNPKCLNVDFGSEGGMEKAVASTCEDGQPKGNAAAGGGRDERVSGAWDRFEMEEKRVCFVFNLYKGWLFFFFINMVGLYRMHQ